MNGGQKSKPVTFVIFGATGDLARTKLFGALFDLAKNHNLPSDYAIIGFSRREWDDSAFQNFVSEIFAEKKNVQNEVFDKFIRSLRYIKGDFSLENDYKKAAELVAKIDKERGVCGDRLLYLAAPPVNYEAILRVIDGSGLSIPCGGNQGWARILIEKPFGTDVKNAERLENLLSKLFIEEQIFRIDHYLAKETVQNILTFRFSNTLFEPVWNKRFIESVHITLLEKDRGDTANRGLFYDGLGALRDVGQNHLLQMLALIAMENPRIFDGKSVRKSRAAVFKKLSVNKKGHYLRGQYEGYLKEPNVRSDSETETYFFAEAGVKNSRWRGVPFYIESGKKLENNEVKIKIVFKPEAFCLMPPLCNIYHNQITFHIQPKEEIEIRFWLKKPGFKIELQSENFNHSYKGNPEMAAPGAYERVLYDAIVGDQTLFAGSDEIAQSWKFISKVRKKLKASPLVKYKSGSKFEMGKLE